MKKWSLYIRSALCYSTIVLTVYQVLHTLLLEQQKLSNRPVSSVIHFSAVTLPLGTVAGRGWGRLQLKCDGTRWRTGGEVKGKLANGVGSQYSSNYLGTWCIQHYYRWCAHLGCQLSTELAPPDRFEWTRPFRRKTKSCFLACAITFQLASTTRSGACPTTYFQLN